jgi:hypothetical protein
MAVDNTTFTFTYTVNIFTFDFVNFLNKPIVFSIQKPFPSNVSQQLMRWLLVLSDSYYYTLFVLRGFDMMIEPSSCMVNISAAQYLALNTAMSKEVV